MTWLIPALLAVYAATIAWTAARSARGRRLDVIRRGFARLAVIYLGIIIVFLFLEKKLLYHPTKSMAYGEVRADAGNEDVWLTSDDGTRLHAHWYPLADAAWCVLYSHGNAGNASDREWSCKFWRKLGASVLIYDYPGYGRSDGRPSEAGCQAAARAAYVWLVGEKRVPPEKLVLFGESLGCAMAVELAVTRPHRALVLYAPFTSIPDMAGEIFPWLPMRWLVTTKYDNLSKIRNYHGPLFLAHGTADSIIPFQHSERLFAAAPGPTKRLFPAPNLDHNEALVPEVFAAIGDFLKGLPPGASPHGDSEMPPP